MSLKVILRNWSFFDRAVLFIGHGDVLLFDDPFRLFLFGVVDDDLAHMEDSIFLHACDKPNFFAGPLGELPVDIVGLVEN